MILQPNNYSNNRIFRLLATAGGRFFYPDPDDGCDHDDHDDDAECNMILQPNNYSNIRIFRLLAPAGGRFFILILMMVVMMMTMMMVRGLTFVYDFKAEQLFEYSDC